jgi:hypothetical protein
MKIALFGAKVETIVKVEMGAIDKMGGINAKASGAIETTNPGRQRILLLPVHPSRQRHSLWWKQNLSLKQVRKWKQQMGLRKL